MRNLGYAVTAGVLFRWLLVFAAASARDLALYGAQPELLLKAIGTAPELLAFVTRLAALSCDGEHV